MKKQERERQQQLRRERDAAAAARAASAAAVAAETTYRPNQAGEHFCPYVPRTPKWFLDCGPACAEEYLDARAAWPGVKLLGLEPSPVGYAAAKARWPADGVLLNVAGWDADGEIVLHKATDMLHGTAYSDFARSLRDDTSGTSGDSVLAPCRALDSLDAEYGPFEAAALWLDVDGSELRVLRGAAGLLARGAIIAVNVETRPQNAKAIGAVLLAAGLRPVRRYLECRTYWDEVWVTP